MSDSQIESFSPVYGGDCRVLILGSMPGAESLRQQQYYAHKRNAFWPIMAQLLGFDCSVSYKERCELLIDNKVALWDVCKYCVRPGSLDSNISDEIPNDFELLLRACPDLTAIFFNGQAAMKLFKRHVELHGSHKQLAERSFLLPSTSPANAGMNIEQKLHKWAAVIDALGKN